MQAVGSAIKRLAFDHYRIRELDGRVLVRTSTPNLTVWNQGSPDFAIVHQGAVVRDGDIGEPDALHDFSTLTWQREIQNERLRMGRHRAGEKHSKQNHATNSLHGKSPLSKLIRCREEDETSRFSTCKGLQREKKDSSRQLRFVPEARGFVPIRRAREEMMRSHSPTLARRMGSIDVRRLRLWVSVCVPGNRGWPTQSAHGAFQSRNVQCRGTGFRRLEYPA